MDSQRVLLAWGMVFLVISLCGGLFLGIQVNPTLDEKERHFMTGFEQLSTQDAKSGLTELKRAIEIDENFRHLSVVHSHIACMAFIAILFGLIQRFLGLSDRSKRISAWFLIVGTLFHETGVLLELVNKSVGGAFAGIGAALIIFSGALTLSGMIKYVKPQHESQ